jgi:hypothetical protein
MTIDELNAIAARLAKGIRPNKEEVEVLITLARERLEIEALLPDLEIVRCTDGPMPKVKLLDPLPVPPAQPRSVDDWDRGRLRYCEQRVIGAYERINVVQRQLDRLDERIDHIERGR